MRYWLYDKANKRVLGPYIIARLSTLPGFGPESKVAPEGARKRSEWKPAKEFPELAVLFQAK
ncbi:MAG: hypothetical protein WC728_02900 [Elusimicrobiota bacterium]